MSGCGSVVPVADDGTDTDGGSTSSAGETGLAETDNPGTSTFTTAATTTTGPSPGTTDGPVGTTTFGMETGDSSSGDETTGGPDLMCPEDDWPNDGSEIIESVATSSVADWSFTGDGGSYYTYLSDESALPGEESRGLRTDDLDPDGFGVTVATISAEPFLGQRVRMRGWVARSGVEKQANLWLRVDAVGGFLTLDNGTDRPGYGTSADWELEEIVIDVPLDASTLAFGSLLIGRGAILVNDPTFDIVSEDVPTTQPNLRRPPQANACLDGLGRFGEELVHIARPDAWTSNDPELPGGLRRDEVATFEGVPAAHLSGSNDGVYAGFLSWSDDRPGQRLRLTVPMRAESFTGEVRLVFTNFIGETGVGHQSSPIVPGEEWSTFSVVTELPEAFDGSQIGISVAGSGDLWLGYGVVERVSEGAPLSEPME